MNYLSSIEPEKRLDVQTISRCEALLEGLPEDVSGFGRT